MTIHVNIGEAKARLSALVEAALRGEEVILQKAGVPKLKLVPLADAEHLRREEIVSRRRAAFEAAAQRYSHLHGSDETIVPTSMSESELERREQRF